ncbi:MAG TPA: cupin domain-containing protein [Solirubrobacteraceae bacterium]|jgi:quercetin dioxygenase-like cupin family protein|nr:cupin domain-containing protein [Solirubrobacteraceae bacterium]
MSFPPRRVVTGHDDQGRATVSSDDVVDNGVVRRPGHRSFVLWTTDKVPVEHDGAESASGLTTTDRSLAEGTVFRIVEYRPGVTPARHQTDSVDYAVVVAGEIDLVLDDQTVHLQAGDTLVQRATAHDWINNGDVPCVVAFCLIGALPQPGGPPTAGGVTPNTIR